MMTKPYKLYIFINVRGGHGFITIQTSFRFNFSGIGSTKFFTTYLSTDSHTSILNRLPIDLPTSLRLYLSIILSTYLATSISIYRSIYLPCCMSLCSSLSICVSIYLAIHAYLPAILVHPSVEVRWHLDVPALLPLSKQLGGSEALACLRTPSLPKQSVQETPLRSS